HHVRTERGDREAEVVTSGRDRVEEHLAEQTGDPVVEVRRTAAARPGAVRGGGDQYVGAHCRDRPSEVRTVAGSRIEEGTDQRATGAVEDVDRPGVRARSVVERGADDDLGAHHRERESE